MLTRGSIAVLVGLIFLMSSPAEAGMPPPMLLSVQVDQTMLSRDGFSVLDTNGIPVNRTAQHVPPGPGFVVVTTRSMWPASRMTRQFRLKGFDRGWTDCGTRSQMFYINVPPGRYELDIRDVGPDGHIYPTDTVSFVLEPHFYQMRVFQAGMGGLILLSIAIAIAALMSRRSAHRQSASAG